MKGCQKQVKSGEELPISVSGQIDFCDAKKKLGDSVAQDRENDCPELSCKNSVLVSNVFCNKGDLAKSYGTLAEILLPATIRNTIAWVGAALGYELSFRFALTIFDSVIISLLLGMFFGMLSIPFDV